MLQSIHEIDNDRSMTFQSPSWSCLLPVELIICILEQLYLTEKNYRDYYSLKRCSLVGRTWRGPSQELLFRSCSLKRSKGDLEQLVKIFERNTGLGQCVRLLEIQIGLATEKRRKSYSPKDFFPIISLFPKLYGLSVKIGDQETRNLIDAEIAATQLTPGRDLPQLVSLDLDHSGQSRLLYNLLALWPSIQRLTCNIGCFESPPPGSRPDFTLSHLGLDIVPPPQVLKWLLPNNTLRSFHVKAGLRYDPSILHFLKLYGPNLRSLQLEYLPESLIECCPNLKELDVRYMLLDVLENVTGHLPRSLQRVQFRHLKPRGRPLLKFARSLPNLRVLSLPGTLTYKRLFDDIWFDDVAKLRRRHGVVLEYGMCREDLNQGIDMYRGYLDDFAPVGRAWN